MLPLDIRLRLEYELGEKVQEVSPVSGGCIGTAAKLRTGSGVFFAKWGNPDVARTFSTERIGLRSLLEAAHLIRIPEVVAEFYADSGDGILVLEWIEEGQYTTESWARLGRGLAEIHETNNELYGFSSDNFIGASVQSNGWEANWVVFFREKRLIPQMKMARSRGLWRSTWDADFNRLLDGLEAVLPENPGASFVHGDLWKGNVLVDSNGIPVLVDPAVYYGHHEVDIAMSLLFGEFGRSFYDSYAESCPLEDGFSQRREVYNLYHLLNHLNLFGSSYGSAVEIILRSFEI